MLSNPGAITSSMESCINGNTSESNFLEANKIGLLHDVRIRSSRLLISTSFLSASRFFTINANGR